MILSPPLRERVSEAVEFAAQVGRRVRLTIVLVGVVLAAVSAVSLWLAFTRPMPPAARAVVVGAPVFAIGAAVALAWFSRIRGYRLTRDTLEIQRRPRPNSFPLAGLTGAEVDAEAMAWSIKLFGNDGLGAITGRYRNRRLGSYRAFVSDPRRLAVLRWPDRCVVISPDRPEEFVAAVRERAGLRD